MVASVDGIGKTIEYMRRRCSWDKIVDNVDICNKYDNVDVDFNGLVSFLSVLRFYEMIDWCLDEGKDKVNMVNWAMLEHPTHLRTNNLPQKLKDDLLPKYEGWPDINNLVIDLEEKIDWNITDSILFKIYERQKPITRIGKIKYANYLINNNSINLEQKNIIIEKHVKLKNSKGPDASTSIDTKQLSNLVSHIRILEKTNF